MKKEIIGMMHIFNQLQIQIKNKHIYYYLFQPLYIISHPSSDFSAISSVEMIH